VSFVISFTVEEVGLIDDVNFSTVKDDNGCFIYKQLMKLKVWDLPSNNMRMELVNRGYTRIPLSFFWISILVVILFVILVATTANIITLGLDIDSPLDIVLEITIFLRCEIRAQTLNFTKLYKGERYSEGFECMVH
jgi:hypothetical protein